ncbi:MAG: T9SS type A sorting domain-containing protein [Phaeodactylibacter sp.]|nr:T9SS type A sorting domain-containing protein [Phaeodactylibacter sp.]
MKLPFHLKVVLFLSFGWNLFSQAQTTIYDIQFVSAGSSSDASSYVGQTVTVSGIVTASVEAGNLDIVFLQQPDEVEWAGIQLIYDPALAELKVGDAVTLTGTVKEEAGVTKLDDIDEVEVTGTGTIMPLVLDPALFSNWDLTLNEKYEGMLIALQNVPDLISVVSKNPDNPNNYGEWRVGTDIGNPDSGCRILTGRQTSQVASSLNVSYINDLVWATNSGMLNVAPIVVEDGDEFYAIIGLITNYSGNVVLLPRNNADVITEIPNSQEVPPVALRSAQVYPNPSSRTATLELEVTTADTYQVFLFNSLGERMQQVAVWPNLPSGHYTRQLHFDEQLVPGMYLLSIEGRQGKVSITLIIE